jgi:Aldo/keto reductase family/Cupin
MNCEWVQTAERRSCPDPPGQWELDRAGHLRHRVAMEGDPLADVLTLASARCVRIGTLKAGGTWALKFPPPQKIKLIAVAKGGCWLAVDGERAPLRLQTGDVFMVPAARSYVLASDLKASQLDGLALFTKATDSVGTVGNGEDFFAIGGHVALDPDRGGVLADVLPPVIHVDASSSEASTIRWLLDQLVKEVTANPPGVVLASKQLAQLLFVQIIRFGVEQIDLWQLHRIDPRVPRDEQFGAMRQLLDDGIIRHAGLSEVSVADIEAARRVFPVATVQNRYNLVDRGPEDVLAYCATNNIGFIPWFPLAAGELTRPGGTVDRIAKAHGATAGQVALAWLLRHNPVILPIPGTLRVAHLEENVAAAGLSLTPEELAELDAAA